MHFLLPNSRISKAVWLAVPLLLPACADKEALRRQQDRLTSVEAQLTSIQSQLDQMQNQTDENRSSILILEDKLDTARQYINTIKTNQEVKIIRVTPEMMASASDLPPAEPVRTPAPKTEPAPKRTPPSPPAPPAPAAEVTPPPAPQPRSRPAVAVAEPAQPKSKQDYRNPVDMYGAAFKLFEAERYDEGLELFREFVRRWPNHDYADNSQYWIGECFYSRSEYEQAMAEFEKVLKRYPTGNKAPDALLKIGFSLRKLGRKREAGSALQRLLNEYPFSDAAPKARARLEDWAQGRE